MVTNKNEAVTYFKSPALAKHEMGETAKRACYPTGMRSVLTLPFSSMTHVGNDINVMQWKNARNLTRRPSIRVSGKKKPFCKYAKVQNGGLHK